MRARATVGEVSQVLARVFGRYEATNMTATGVFSESYKDEAEWEKLTADVQRFLVEHGRRPRLLLAKLGQDGHDRGVKVVAAGLSDLGFDVDLGPLFQTPDDVARQALESDVHFVGISTQAGAHLTLVPELIAALSRLGAGGIEVVVGGIVPVRDHEALLGAGVRAVFGPGAKVTDIARRLLDLASLATASGASAP
jgi:methylmalonyl-CoA mutase